MQKEWEYGSLFDGQVHSILQCLYFIMPWEAGAGNACLTKPGRKNPLLNAIVLISSPSRSFVSLAAPAVMQRGCKGMLSDSKKKRE